MSAKDMVVKVLQKNTRYVTQDDISSSPFVKTPEAIFEEDISDVADQILDSLPRLDRDRISDLIWDFIDDYGIDDYLVPDYEIEKLIDQICSLIPEQQTVQEFAEEVFGGKMRSMTKEEIKKEEEYEKEKYDVCSLTPACEVIATGSVDQITDKIESYLNNYLTLECELPRTIIRATIQGLIGLDQCNKGTLVWVPDKEDK